MKETKFRAWILDSEWHMYTWRDYFFSDMTRITHWSDSFPDGSENDVILMQYVGKQDMNGVDIYEDDIIYKETCAPDDPAHGSYGAVGVIREDTYNMGWVIEAEGSDARAFYDHDGCANFEFNEIKVIGNVHENPELLE